MSQLILPGSSGFKQSDWQKLARTSRHLLDGLGCLFIGGSGFDFVNKNQFLKYGSPTQSTTLIGKAMATASSSSGWYAPDNASGGKSDKLYDPSSPVLTLFIVGCGVAGVNNGISISRSNGSGVPSYCLGFWAGSFNGVYGDLKTTSSSIGMSPSSSGYSIVSGIHVGVFSVSSNNSILFLDGRQQSSASTPSGSMYYEYGDTARTLTVGGSSTYGGGSLAMAGAIYGRAWSQPQAKLFTDMARSAFRKKLITVKSMASFRAWFAGNRMVL